MTVRETLALSARYQGVGTRYGMQPVHRRKNIQIQLLTSWILFQSKIYRQACWTLKKWGKKLTCESSVDHEQQKIIFVFFSPGKIIFVGANVFKSTRPDHHNISKKYSTSTILADTAYSLHLEPAPSESTTSGAMHAMTPTSKTNASWIKLRKSAYLRSSLGGGGGGGWDALTAERAPPAGVAASPEPATGTAIGRGNPNP